MGTDREREAVRERLATSLGTAASKRKEQRRQPNETDTHLPS